MKTLLLLLLLITPAFAYNSGTCKSLDEYYKNVNFKVEESTDLTYAVEFQKSHKGQLITDSDGQFYSVIWNDEIAAPATLYTCTRLIED